MGAKVPRFTAKIFNRAPHLVYQAADKCGLAEINHAHYPELIFEIIPGKYVDFEDSAHDYTWREFNRGCLKAYKSIVAKKNNNGWIYASIYYSKSNQIFYIKPRYRKNHSLS